METNGSQLIQTPPDALHQTCIVAATTADWETTSTSTARSCVDFVTKVKSQQCLVLLAYCHLLNIKLSFLQLAMCSHCEEAQRLLAITVLNNISLFIGSDGGSGGGKYNKSRIISFSFHPYFYGLIITIVKTPWDGLSLLIPHALPILHFAMFSWPNNHIYTKSF